MAQISDRARQDVDWLLELALFQWQRLPEVQAEIDRWDLLDQLNFIEEWPIEEDRLTDLERLAAEGALTPEQQARYQALLRVVEAHRPILRRLQES